MFSFAMTSGLASVFDKFKIIITRRRGQKFWDTGPYTNFDFLSNPIVPEVFAIQPKSSVRYKGRWALLGFTVQYKLVTFSS